MSDPLREKKGQALVMVLAILIIAGILVPLMVYYAQRESVWTAKESKSTEAFHIAEAGSEKAYLELSLSTAAWSALQLGQTISGYNFDQVYTDAGSGSYSLKITSGPGTQEATILSVAKDSLGREIRALKVEYANAGASNVAILGGTTIDISGNNLQIEWGAVMSQSSITVNNKLHPQYYSAGNIDLDNNGATPPNCDSPNCWFWHSYDINVPPMPQLDFQAYKSSAQAADAYCTAHGAPCACSACGTFYVNGSCSGSCNDTSGNTYFVTGNWTSFGGPLVGNVIVLGNLTTPNGSMSGQNISPYLPQQAWKQYCNDWTYYRTNYDGGASNPYVNACPGLSSTYLSVSTITYSMSPVIQGLLYVGGTFTGPNGGGNSTLGYGVLMVQGQINLNSNSHCKWFYNPTTSQNMLTTNLTLSRVLWEDKTGCTWTGTYPTCP